LSAPNSLRRAALGISEGDRWTVICPRFLTVALRAAAARRKANSLRKYPCGPSPPTPREGAVHSASLCATIRLGCKSASITTQKPILSRVSGEFGFVQDNNQMPLMNWDQSLDIGVDAMNRDHQKLLDVMNRIYDSREKGGSAVNLLVQQLGALCVKHFKDEEAFMISIGFPDLESHKRVHARLLSRYGEFAEAIQKNDGKPSDEFFQFLRLWLASHIKCIDVKYGEHSAQKTARKIA